MVLFYSVARKYFSHSPQFGHYPPISSLFDMVSVVLIRIKFHKIFQPAKINLYKNKGPLMLHVLDSQDMHGHARAYKMCPMFRLRPRGASVYVASFRPGDRFRNC